MGAGVGYGGRARDHDLNRREYCVSCWALAMPSIALLVLDLFPDNRGLAASLQGAQQSFFTGLAAGLLSPFVAGTGSGLACSMALLVVCGFACWSAFARLPRPARST